MLYQFTIFHFIKLFYLIKKISNITFFFFLVDKQGYPNLFKYLTILSGVCNSPVPHTPGYYREESHGGDPKMLVRGFEPKIL